MIALGRPKDKILTRRRDQNFKTICLSIIQDDNDLSWKAKGIHTYLISRPDDWEFNYPDLVGRASDGITALKSGLNELEEKGYLKREQLKDEDGKFTKSQWTVAETPDMLADQPEVGFPSRKTRNGKPATENHPPNKQYSSKKNFSKKDSNNVRRSNSKENSPEENNRSIENSNSEDRGYDDEVKEKVKDIFNHWTSKENTITHRKNTTPMKKSIHARLEDGFTVGELKTAIDHYNLVVGSPKYYFSYDNWSLDEFMSRGEGKQIEKFLQHHNTYLKDEYRTSQKKQGVKPGETKKTATGS